MIRSPRLALPLLLAACSDGTVQRNAYPTPAPSASPTPSPSPSPTSGSVDAQITEAAAQLNADTCFREGRTNCNWTTHAYDPAEFTMAPDSGEAILIVDDFPRLPVRAIRYRKRIKAFYRASEGGGVFAAQTQWRVPTALWNALDRFSGPAFVPSHRLAPLAGAANRSYADIAFDNIGHGSTVFSLLSENVPEQPLVVMDSMDLAKIAPAEYCDLTTDPAKQADLVAAARRTATAILHVIRSQNIRFINYSAGHSLETIRGSWLEKCNSLAPADAILRQKLAAYAPIYSVLFGTPGVLALQAGAQNELPENAPYDQRDAAYYNRLRVGYFTALASGLDEFGRGNLQGLQAWPVRSAVDLYVNTGVLPDRPFRFNLTPLLGTDAFSTSVLPITRPQTSWAAPLALARLVNLRFSSFPNRAFDDTLIADIFGAAAPARCPGELESRCAHQDPLLHGQIEAVRLGFRPREFTGF